MPKISVIIPVYNVEKYLCRCIDSILAQTFTDFELILVDDGSPDNCGMICEEYKEKDDRICVIHQENGGLSAARNAGIDWAFANSDSEWITFIDSDDWVHPKYLEALYHAVIDKRVSISICGFERTEGYDPVVDPDQLESVLWQTEDYFIENNVNAIVAWGKLHRKDYFKEIRYPVGKLHEDEFTTYKILFKEQKVAVINQPLYAYYQNSEGIMGKPWSVKRLEKLTAIKEQINYFRINKFNEAYLFAIEKYFKAFQWQMPELKKIAKKKQYRIVRSKLRKELRKFRDVYAVSGHENVYRLAYPIEMKIRKLRMMKKKR